MYLSNYIYDVFTEVIVRAAQLTGQAQVLVLGIPTGHHPHPCVFVLVIATLAVAIHWPIVVVIYL